LDINSKLRWAVGWLIGHGCIANIVSPSYPMTRATADSFDLCKHNSDCFLFRASKYLHLEGLSRLSNASPSESFTGT